MFKLQSPSNYSPFDATHLSRHILVRHFFHCSKQFLNLLILMCFSAFDVFCFTSSTSTKRFPLRTFFIRETKKSCSRWEPLNREGGHRGHAGFGPKLLSTQHGVGRCAHKSPIMRWANAFKESSKKKFTEAECSLSQQCQLEHWYRWVSRTLTYQEKLLLQGTHPPEDNSHSPS